MWGLGGWTGSDDEQTLQSLAEAVALGCNFFDTAWAYGAGHSERLLARTLRRASRSPALRRNEGAAEEPAVDSARRLRARRRVPGGPHPPVHRSQPQNLGVDTIDLQQLHAWSDRWADDDRWQKTLDDLRREGLVRSWGISVNRWETTNVIRALDTGLIDCVQVVYNVFDQDPEDVLFPYCHERGIAVIARVPFDEGSLTGTLTRDTRFPDGDWRNLYFTPAQLDATLPRVDRLKSVVPPSMTLPELALRFILHHPAVTTTIPGMRKLANVQANCAVSDGVAMAPALLESLRAHRWQRDWVVP